MESLQINIQLHFEPKEYTKIITSLEDPDMSLSTNGLMQAIGAAANLNPCDYAITSTTQFQRTKESVQQELKQHQKQQKRLFHVIEKEFTLPNNFWTLEKAMHTTNSNILQNDLFTEYYLSNEDDIPSGAQLLFNMYDHLINNIETLLENNIDKGLVLQSTHAPLINLFHLSLFEALSFDTTMRKTFIDDLRKPTAYQYGEGIIGKLLYNQQNYSLQFEAKDSSRIITLSRLKERRDELYNHTRLQ